MRTLHRKQYCWTYIVLAGWVALMACSICHGATSTDPRGGANGTYSASVAAPDSLTTTEPGKTLVVAGGTPTPDRVFDQGKVRLVSAAGATAAVFVGRSTGWGCTYLVYGLYKVGAGRYTTGADKINPAVWENTFEEGTTPRLVLEVNNAGVDDNFILFGATGTATVKLIDGAAATNYSVTISDPANPNPPFITIAGNPVVLTKALPEKVVTLTGVKEGTGTLKAVCANPALASSPVPYTVAHIVIAEVVRGDCLPYSVSLGAANQKVLAVKFSPGMAGNEEVTFTIEGGSGDNGTASLVGDAPIKLSDDGNITVKGDTQTTPGHDSKLYVKATCGGVEVGRTQGFSVCAHPNAFVKGPAVLTFKEGNFVGLKIAVVWTSDFGEPTNYLDKAEGSEHVSLAHSQVGSCVGLKLASFVSAYHAITGSAIDKHSMYIPTILDRVDNHGGSGSMNFSQVMSFYCSRCGMTKQSAGVMPQSGYDILYSIIKGADTKVDLNVTVTKKAVSVDGFSASAGTGDGGTGTRNVRP